jgi:ribonuclease HI
VLEYGEFRRELSGANPATTNNRMELQAAIQALAALKESCQVEFFTDSEYVKNGVLNWLKIWKRNGWKTRLKKPVKNEDLWRALDFQASRHQVQWHWLKGHAGHPENEKCDQLAGAEIARLRKTLTVAQLKALLAQFQAGNATASAAAAVPDIEPGT